MCPLSHSDAVKKMIKDAKLLYEFEKDLMKKDKIDVMKNFQMIDAMYNEAVALGVFALGEPLEGLETELKIARVLNYVPNSPPLKTSLSIRLLPVDQATSKT